MGLKIDSFDIKIKGLKKEIRILQISDLHLTCYDEFDIPLAKTELPARKELFDKEIDNAYDRSKLLAEYYSFAEKNNCDILLITGDLSDAPSNCNFKLISDVVKNSEMKTVFMLGNHDWTFSLDYQADKYFEYSYPKYADIFGERSVDDEGNVHIQWNSDNEVYDFGEFVLFCVDNGHEKYSEHSLEKLKCLRDEKIPVVLCTHIPFSTETAKEDVKSMWGRDICIGSSDIECDDTTKEFLNIIFSSDTPVNTVICGHTHQSHIDKLCDANNTVQYTLGASYQGYARIFNIMGDK